MDTVTIRLDEELSAMIDKNLKPYYSTKTEFIREAIRDKLKSIENEFMLREFQRRAKPKRTKPLSEKERQELYEEVAKKPDSEVLREFNLQGVRKV